MGMEKDGEGRRRAASDQDDGEDGEDGEDEDETRRRAQDRGKMVKK